MAVGDRGQFGSHTLDAEEIKRFAAQFDPQPFHLDEEAGRQSHFGGLCASGWHTASLWMKYATLYRDREEQEARQRGEPSSRRAPSPGFRDLRWHKAVYPGDTISFASEIIDKRTSNSRPEWGIIFSRNTATNQKGELVYSFLGSLFVERRPG